MLEINPEPTTTALLIAPVCLRRVETLKFESFVDSFPTSPYCSMAVLMLINLVTLLDEKQQLPPGVAYMTYN